jgi:toxin ParE1/3/4
MRVVISDTAKAEIAEQIAYIRERNPDAARRQRERISRAVALLRETPGLGGRPGRMEGTRELVISGTPFILIFEASATRIDIIHVLHGRQQWPPQEADEE